jgi:chromosome segregation ATPase
VGWIELRLGKVMMESKTISLTDEIYAELVAGLERGELDWTAFIAKHSASKGPLYNAIGRFFHDMEPKVKALNEVQAQLDQAGLRLDSLDQKVKEAESSLAPLENRRKVLTEQIETLKMRLAEKSELIKRVEALEKLGLDMERLRQLQDALGEIGAKHGLKAKEAVGKFFEDLKDYDAKIGFEREIQRLEAITDTKKLEAGKWEVEADSLARRHKDLSEVITAVQNLMKHGVKTEQIVSWNGIVSRLGGPEELHDKLGQYRSMSELLEAKGAAIENGSKKVTELGAQIKALNEQKAEIEGAIKALSTSGVNKINEVSDKAVTELKSLSTSGVKRITDVSGKALTDLESLSTSGVQEITRVGDKALTELKSVLVEIRGETKRLADLKAEAGKLEKELMYARYLTTTDQAVLEAFPMEVVFSLLDRVASYCQFKNLNAKVKMPDHMYDRYCPTHFITPPEVSLPDLITWLQVGLVGASQ